VAGLPDLRKLENSIDLILTGSSTKRILSEHFTKPIINFRPTFPDMVRAVQEAMRADHRIAIAISEESRTLDFNLISELLNVDLWIRYCDSIEAYEDACREANKSRDMITSAIKNAIDLYQIHQDGLKRISQLKTIMENFTGGLLLTDESGKIMFNNPQASGYLKTEKLSGANITDIFHSQTALEALENGRMCRNVVEEGNLVVDYTPIQTSEAFYGLVCTFRKVKEIEDAEFTVRKKLHRQGFQVKYRMDDIVGNGPAISDCKKQATMYARVMSPVLITGESGTGKELFAHAIHAFSELKSGPFVAINCAALPNELLESELFGYEKGAFTGAQTSGKKGLAELAHRGTLFLDEITSLNNVLQAKLLRLLAEQEVLRVGSDHIVPVEVRVVAATNADVESLVADHLFREDLYYRLNVFRLHIPPLRERQEDLVPLFFHFVNRIRPEIAVLLLDHRDDIKHGLIDEYFKGNVRELENIVRRFCLLFEPARDCNDISVLLKGCSGNSTTRSGVSKIPSDLKTYLEIKEKEILQEMTRKFKNNSEVCRILNIDNSTLWRKIKKYDIAP
jgi:transcriptional regulator with PAS, ATPase and Fis domain